MQRTLKKQFGGNGKPCKYEARIAELERMLGQLHAENELLKKSLCHVTEEDPRGTNKIAEQNKAPCGSKLVL